MTQNAAFRRKVVYLGLIALLLIPLYVVGHPAVGDPRDTGYSAGGRLAQLRAQHDLSPAEIGDIDPTSESMKLATLGMRGVAATILWSKANDFKKKENWEGLIAVVIQMSKLQPNFISVWEFQSHNLTYNISVEQDDYRFRYAWVKRGIEFLIQGTHYNRREPRLFHLVGWYTGQKMGRADESKQFRRMFRDDKDFHKLQAEYVDIDGEGRGADGQPDSWLVSRLWYNRAYDLVDTQGRMLRGKTPHIFFIDGPKALTNYALAIEDEGFLDERAEYAWRRADEELTRYGDRQVPTSTGLIIRLNDEESQLADSQRYAAELDALVPGAREAIEQEKIDQLTPFERDAIKMPGDQITDPNVYSARYNAFTKTKVTHKEVAGRAPADVRARAYRLAQQAEDAATFADWIDRYRQNVNFEYWRTRCKVEQLRDTVTARRHIYNANQLREKVELDAARAEYEKAWDLWAKVIDEYPVLLDALTDDDLYEHVDKYQKLLAQFDERLPADFKLRPLLERRGRMTAAVATEEASNTDAAAKPTADASKPEPKSESKPADEPTPEEKPASAESKPEAKPEAKPEPKPESKPADEPTPEKKPASEEPKPESKPETTPEPKPESKPADEPTSEKKAENVEPKADPKPQAKPVSDEGAKKDDSKPTDENAD
ncbi:MAG: hypothetical protein AB7O38_05515 [Pirellulaceae bacterium]